MRVVVAGGHGQIALRLERLLAARGDHVVGLVRNPDHVPDLEDVGAAGLVLDLENATPVDVAAVTRGADAVVFAAGAGPGSGAARKDTVDRAAAALLADAAERTDVRRYLLVSSVGVESPPPPGTDDVFAAYLRAKAAAEADLTVRDLDWTVLRPGRLTDDPGTGFVQLERRVSRGSVPRDDVAAVLQALLDEPASAGLVLELVLGDVPVAEAVRRACADGGG
ncbi:MAG TPA: NAD(P)H-binding protein [Jiangellales bacterium]|nr:NAD(P)H-binding protein [Jiangellales bacterium]